MSLAEQLEKKKAALQKTKVKDASGPKITGYISKDEVKQYYEQCLDVNLEEWIDIIRDHTFPTQLVPFTPEDAKAIMEACKEMKRTQSQELTGKLKERFASLVAKVDPLVKTLGEGSGVFVKLSCRSAKDAVRTKQLADTYNRYVLESKTRDDNSKLIALTRAGTDVMRLSSAQAAMDMLARSDRVYEDLEMALEPENIGRFQQNIIVRKWVPLAADMEFRGFVCGGKLNALSQYNYPSFFPRLIKYRKLLAERIQEFFDKTIREVLLKKGFERYVIDFGVVEKKSDKQTGLGEPDEELDIERILVIELNPWGSSTDSGLFSFKDESETVLSHGPFELRIREKVVAGVAEYLAAATKEWVVDKPGETPAAKTS